MYLSKIYQQQGEITWRKGFVLVSILYESKWRYKKSKFSMTLNEDMKF